MVIIYPEKTFYPIPTPTLPLKEREKNVSLLSFRERIKASKRFSHPEGVRVGLIFMPLCEPMGHVVCSP